MRITSKAVTLFKELGMMNELSTSLTNVAISHSKLEEYDAAIKYFEEAKVLAEQIGGKDNMAHISHNMALAQVEIGQMAAARVNNQKAMKLFVELQKVPGIANSLILEGTILAKSGDINGAIAQYKAALIIGEEIDSKEIKK